MSYLPEVELSPTFVPFASFQKLFGFVPNLFRAQTLLPRMIEAEAGLSAAVLLRGAGSVPNPERVYYCWQSRQHIETRIASLDTIKGCVYLEFRTVSSIRSSSTIT